MSLARRPVGTANATAARSGRRSLDFMVSSSSGSLGDCLPRELRPREEHMLAVLEQGRRAAAECGLVVGETDLDVAVEMPVQTHTPGERLAGGHLGAGEAFAEDVV